MGWPSNYLTIQTVDCSEQLTLAGMTFFFVHPVSSNKIDSILNSMQSWINNIKKKNESLLCKS